MQIPLHKILEKMQAELDQAKQTNNEGKVREHLVIIQTLCDLVVEERSKSEQTMSTTPFIQQPVPTTQTTKLKEDDGNGDSLFDF
ncbi:YwdI family protein [Cytobacillus suaedae]|nr:YwdI family protein [Cytobacillus suaedae]